MPAVLFSAGMGRSPFRSLKTKPKKAMPPTRAAVLRAARAILYPEAGDPLPEPGTALEREAIRFVEFIGRQEAAKLTREANNAQST